MIYAICILILAVLAVVTVGRMLRSIMLGFIRHPVAMTIIAVLVVLYVLGGR